MVNTKNVLEIIGAVVLVLLVTGLLLALLIFLFLPHTYGTFSYECPVGCTCKRILSDYYMHCADVDYR